jgi:hypothetical protein
VVALPPVSSFPSLRYLTYTKAFAFRNIADCISDFTDVFLLGLRTHLSTVINSYDSQFIFSMKCLASACTRQPSISRLAILQVVQVRRISCGRRLTMALFQCAITPSPASPFPVQPHRLPQHREAKSQPTASGIPTRSLSHIP